MSAEINLFKLRTIIPDFAGCKDVSMRWVVWGRKRPPAPYPDLIANYRPDDVYAQCWIDELFTTDEAKKLISYLETHHPQRKNSIEKVNLPASGDLFPILALSVGGPTGHYELACEETYDLPFWVLGAYDLEEHEPLLNRESDLIRRKAFARSTFYVINGKVLCAADLEEIDRLH
ncbi:hypothetical protein [Mesorhizobium sp. B2-8-5]|uniref:hypothetical protein n=1 Tax=Mesorhizobium sp. B2-8-5 TaxID=2589903 RepID=UPI00112AB169|nr:hypothetical protein [Mesorhizobium sp. B2-8-5]UCI23508.1 hypothetical protein FJ430_17980 [Mesorhizobium sp. B2-8-5]